MPSELLDPIEVALALARAFEHLGIEYFLGGSMASSMQGEPRATNDIDFVVRLAPEQVAALAQALAPEFDVDTEALTEAARRHAPWNIFHSPSVTKIDLFMLRPAPYDQAEFARRRRVEVRPGEALIVKTPEDTILRKLCWYRDGGAVSSTQWRDVVEVLKVSAGSLEAAYLEDWAAKLGVSELLARARGEAGGRA